jgi:hypothetical protein
MNGVKCSLSGALQSMSVLPVQHDDCAAGIASPATQDTTRHTRQRRQAMKWRTALNRSAGMSEVGVKARKREVEGEEGRGAWGR